MDGEPSIALNASAKQHLPLSHKPFSVIMPLQMGRDIETFLRREERDKERPVRVLSLGGSLFFGKDGSINEEFLLQFRDFVEKRVKSGETFVIVCGGGEPARKYRDLAQKLNPGITKDRLDQIGIEITRLNALLLQSLFKEEAYSGIINELTEGIELVGSCMIFIGAGSTPGHSTDTVAVRLAKKFGVSKVLNLTNVDRVFTKDPKKDATAEPIEKTTWQQLRELGIIDGQWLPGLNFPFDPVAAREAAESKIEVVVANGNNLQNLENIMGGKQFVGTTIEPNGLSK